ncbi:MAG TPA: hypothetical protein VIK18_09135, partial [Pirellulales bacterium]
MFVAALGFLLQSYVTQTHIHVFPAGSAGASHITSPLAARGESPIDKPADCPFCQAILHAGLFVASPAPLLFLPLM